MSKNTHHVDADALRPDFESHEGLAVAEDYPFWLGLTADCPVNQIDVAGLHFPKAEESIVINNEGKQVRVPVLGALNYQVTREHFDALVATLPRLVIRFTDKEPEVDNDGSGVNIGDPIKRARKGYLIKIPTKKTIADAAESGQRKKPYIRKPGDRPAMDFMYFQHVADKQRANNYQTIADAGLEWPEELEQIDDLLS